MEPPETSLDSDGSKLETAERIILRWDSAATDGARGKMIFQSDRDEVDRFLRAVDEIQRSLSSVSFSSSSSSAATTVDEHEVKANSAIQIAMARLEDEFRNILLSHTTTFEPDSLFLEESSSVSPSLCVELGEDTTTVTTEEEELNSPGGSGSSRLTRRRSSYRSTSSIREMDLISPEAVSDLRSIVQRMVAAGYSRECIQVYGTVRKSAMETIFKQLGIVKISIGDVQKLEWEVVEGKIRKWIRAAKVCIRVVFSSEKRLCEQLFDGICTAMDETCFMETVKASALRLFTFPEAISISRRSPEKLFKILDLHDALTDMLPDIEAIFDSDSSDAIRAQAVEIQSRLAEASRGILSEFENAVLREPSIVPVPGGTIHPLTRYVMNYIVMISDYKQTLDDLIMSNPSTGSDPNTPDMDFTELESKSPLDLHLIWLIVVLHFNLEEKSKHYRDTSLSHIFIMNNIHYIVQKVKRSPELREMIGDHYLRKLTGIFRHAATNYQRATWVRVLNSLRDEGLHVSGSFSSGVSRSALRERFKAFNTMFEEVHRTQSTWSVPDAQLREELRISLSEHLIPAYRSFLGRFRGHIESGRHPENYLKYSVEDIETIVLDLFEGYTTPPHLRRR
ncbi:LOW QUALITY PROTEIN: exocyst complex component EXO70A1 [Arabidopsis lyrata subsp. lyrata]|uniref:LOW QUALITY PROTEIN: exocyst complex component EXO70A1 n=1 Tax=Arabidopsis lyrata subsp. lyrata TaxID=81972 RepID=UPI000A29BDF5|nr:LOW QUALITY PROTEIN: exocyst complex component EXO70A1 [Arabidopsis lyrata subsp. lyrata]|eukprot:XP_020886606.1 LOW QUALITY PROTEIN: exocyst complex component EXO70A1 [Arabidopsis lyrata subsp. lyrata]